MVLHCIHIKLVLYVISSNVYKNLHKNITKRLAFCLSKSYIYIVNKKQPPSRAKETGI